jgi:hypothetical protein
MSGESARYQSIDEQSVNPSKSARPRSRRTGNFLAGSLDRLPGEYRVALVAEISDDNRHRAGDFLIV